MKSVFASFFDGLQISLLQLFGMMLGAAISLSITLDRFDVFLKEQPERIVFWGVFIGLYTVGIALIGTWTSLGLLGRWAGRNGGRLGRLLIQILGITIAAWITLPGAMAATLIAMIVVGNYLEAREQSTADKLRDDDPHR